MAKLHISQTENRASRSTESGRRTCSTEPLKVVLNFVLHLYNIPTLRMYMAGFQDVSQFWSAGERVSWRKKDHKNTVVMEVTRTEWWKRWKALCALCVYILWPFLFLLKCLCIKACKSWALHDCQRFHTEVTDHIVTVAQCARLHCTQSLISCQTGSSVPVPALKPISESEAMYCQFIFSFKGTLAQWLRLIGRLWVQILALWNLSLLGPWALNCSVVSYQKW